MTMITLTESATAHIKKSMFEKKSAVGFRLSIKKTGCSGYAYVPRIIDEITATDIHFVTPGGIPMYVDTEIVNFVTGLIIDYVHEDTGLKQKRLVFINPNEKNRCGCGESFTVE